jgi:hypothetical protein
MAKRGLWIMINRLHLEDKNPAETTHYQAASLAASILNQPGKLGKYELPPDTRDKIILALPLNQPPLRPEAGRRTNKLRHGLIANIIEDIRCRFPEFYVHRGDSKPARTRESVCSIVATAWAELKSGFESEKVYQELRAILIEETSFPPREADRRMKGLRAELNYGLRKTAKGLGEKQLQRIYDKSPWAKRQSQRRNRY